jgi:hypothetical protein
MASESKHQERVSAVVDAFKHATWVASKTWLELAEVAVSALEQLDRPLHQNAMDAYLRGDLRPMERSPKVRPESVYEQDPSKMFLPEDF